MIEPPMVRAFRQTRANQAEISPHALAPWYRRSDLSEELAHSPGTTLFLIPCRLTQCCKMVGTMWCICPGGLVVQAARLPSNAAAPSWRYVCAEPEWQQIPCVRPRWELQTVGHTMRICTVAPPLDYWTASSVATLKKTSVESSRIHRFRHGMAATGEIGRGPLPRQPDYRDYQTTQGVWMLGAVPVHSTETSGD